MSLSTRDLSVGMRLIIARRRKGLTQAQAAKRHKVSTYTYRAWEEDRLPGGKAPSVGSLAPHEVCFALRVTKGIKQGDLAKKIGVSRWWLRQMERGTANVDRLAAHWGI